VKRYGRRFTIEETLEVWRFPNPSRGSLISICRTA
jgi:hypothetical protein